MPDQAPPPATPRITIAFRPHFDPAAEHGPGSVPPYSQRHRAGDAWVIDGLSYDDDECYADPWLFDEDDMTLDRVRDWASALVAAASGHRYVVLSWLHETQRKGDGCYVARLAERRHVVDLHLADPRRTILPEAMRTELTDAELRRLRLAMAAEKTIELVVFDPAANATAVPPEPAPTMAGGELVGQIRYIPTAAILYFDVATFHVELPQGA